MKDRRKKVCGNHLCETKGKPKYYRSDVVVCPDCSHTLVFVCLKCKKQIADSGISHKICRYCEGNEKEKRQKIRDAGLMVGKGAVAVAAAAGPIALKLISKR